MTHDLKTWPEPFAAIAAETKRHEIRRADRPFRVGDLLVLREWFPISPDGYYTGRVVIRRVTYLTPGGAWGLPADLCVMSIAPVEATVCEPIPVAGVATGTRPPKPDELCSCGSPARVVYITERFGDVPSCR